MLRAPAPTSKWRASLWASVFSLLVFAAQLLPSLHFMLVQHTRCRAHGELVHGQLHDSADERTQGAYALVDVDDDDDAHEHCASIFVSTSSSAPVQDDGVRAALERDTSVARLRDAFARALTSIAVLDFAPKSSPPRA